MAAKAWDRSAASVAAMAPVVELSEFDRELVAVAKGLRRWIWRRPDCPAGRAALMRCDEMMRFGNEGRGEVWRRELAEVTRLALVAAGYLPLARPDDVLVGDVLREVAEEVFKDAKKELKTG